MVRFLICVFGFIIANNWNLYAQTYTSTKFGIEQGLPTLSTKSVTQDYNGLIWVGTDQGVVTFDGYKFQAVSGIPVSFIKQIYKNGDQTLQVISDLGVHQIEVKQGSFETNKLFGSDTSETTTLLNFPKKIVEDSKNRKWYIEYKGVARDDAGKLIHYSIPKEQITSSYVNPYFFFESTNDNYVLFNQKLSSLVLKSQSEKFELFYEYKNSDLYVTQVIQTDSIHYLAATNKGLFSIKIDDLTLRLEPTFVKGYISAIIKKSNGELVLFYRDGRMLHSASGSVADFKEIANISIPAANSIYEDGDHNLWITTDNGLFMLEESIFQKLEIDSDFPFVQFLSQHDSTIYSVIENQVWVIKKKGNKHYKVEQVIKDSGLILSVCNDGNRLVIGKPEGELTIIRDGKKKFIKLSTKELNRIHSPSIFNLYPDNKGRVWIVVGELKGIFLLNTNDEIEFFGENEGFNSTPLDITEGKDGFLYVSATSANSFLYRFDEVNNHFENITPTNLEIVENDILFSAHQMAVDNYGIIWFATSYGIFTFSNDSLEKQPGFDNSSTYLIRSIAISPENGVWIGAENGIFYFKDGKQLAFEESDGLASLSVNYRSMLVDNSGRLWVGTNDGLNYQFNTNSKYRQTPAPYIKSVRIGSNSTYLRPVFIDDFDNSKAITFEFLSYIYPQKKTHYQYKLNDSNWSDFTQQNTVTYKNLSPGDYKIGFRAINRGHNISNTNSLSFTVIPVWYIRWYMWIFYMLVLSLIAWSLFDYWKSIKKERIISGLLDQTERRLQLVLNSAPIILFALNKQLNFTLFSGKSADEFIETNGIRPKHVNQIFQNFSDSKELKTCLEGSEQSVTLQVSDKIFDTRLLPVISISGKVTEVIGISIDITSRIKTEIELLEAKNTAETANAAKSIFLANMSHELRTPLNAIMGFASLLVRQETDIKQQQKYLNTIYSSGEHLLLMINDILDLSKIESGKMDVYLEIVDLFDLINEMENLFLVQSQRKQLQYESYIDDNVPKYTLTDSKKIRQILINLIGNSIKYTQKGGIVIRCKANLVKKRLIFEIEDTGVGIPVDLQRQIFAPFKQVNTTFSDGTGLGLSIVKGMADLLGGAISVKSEAGKGSLFTLELPLHETTNEEIGTKKVNTNEMVKNFKVKKGARALVVDDKFENRELMCDYLLHFGFEVSKAENGLEAVHLAQNEKFDIVMLDIYMPIMDGKTAFKKIKEDKSDLPIIAVSAGGFEEFKKDLELMGFDGFLHKPFKDVDLMNIIRSFVDIERKSIKIEINQLDSDGEKAVVLVEKALRALESAQRQLIIEAIDLMDFDVLTELIHSSSLELKVKNLIKEKINQKDFKFFIQLSEIE